MAVLGSVLFVVLVGSSVSVTSDLKNITAKPGDDVILTCEDTNSNRIFLLEWSRNDLQEEETVFLYRSDAGLLDQHESFRNRVFLKDSQMKDGDLSVVLKNVTMKDTGTYECRVREQKDPQMVWSLISIIRLSVDPPGNKKGQEGAEDGDQDGGGEEEGHKDEESLGSHNRNLFELLALFVVAVAAVLHVILTVILTVYALIDFYKKNK